jgi:HPt (histidine-containing phosphotransfer) domain-containing protein
MASIPGNVEWVGELIPDLEVRRSRFVVDTDEVDDELVEVFIEELQRLTGELQDGIEQNDSEMVRMAAHSIKGMGGTIGLPEISVLGLEIENLTKEDRLPDTAPFVNALAKWMTTLS